MFSECTSIEKLDLSNFNTINVTDMSYMFSRCYALKELNISNFNTNKVISMDCMFNQCPEKFKKKIKSEKKFKNDAF